ncbi:MAG TPA: hypothetical protein VEX41_04005, partial [Candidatus Eisenbacteria bacterium]|nr:hypothetical protein [Candidatus Eisenbacteria bacterium]
LHVEPGPGGGVLERWLSEARSANAGRLRRGFVDAGVDDIEVITALPDETPFGARLRALVQGLDTALGRDAGGLIVLGSGAVPLARSADFRALSAVAGSGEPRALVNNRYSADVVAVGRADILRDVPDLPGDNALPRWLEEVAGIRVEDFRAQARLQMDLDSPIDVLLIGKPPAKARRMAPPAGFHMGAAAPAGVDIGAVRERMAALLDVAADRRAELLVAGRTSPTSLRGLERATACRIRALIEERGLRASTPMAMAAPPTKVRPPRSVLGLLLDERGPAALGAVVTALSDGAVIDTRVLLAHRLGADERRWPAAEDRFASDLLLPDRIGDGWLRALTASALTAPVPIVLGGHSLVGPGLRLLLRRRRSR